MTERPMRIADVKSATLGTAWRNLTFVEVHTDEGLTGVGEVRMTNHTDALLGYLAEAVPNHVIGGDPFEVEALVQRMRVRDFARSGEIVMSGIGAIEMACWDIMGKALGEPVHRLLGGAVRQQIPAYANGWYQVEREPSEFADAARAAVAKGYRALKLDPFGAGYYELSRAERRRSLALVESVRRAVGPEVDLFVEMHGRFNPATAISLARSLEEADPGWIEEPVPPEDLQALAKVAAAVRLPVATGERIHSRTEYRELLALQAADVIQPDIGHFGGLLETRKLAAMAELSHVLVAPHNVAGPVATAAALHFAACTPNFMVQEHFNDFAESHVLAAAPGLPGLESGAFPIPTGHGLGVELDWNVLAEHPRRDISFDLFAEDWHLREATRERGTAGEG